MSPEEIRNTLDDDEANPPSDTTLWRDRGQIIAAQQTRIAQLEAQIARVQAVAAEWETSITWDGARIASYRDAAFTIREAIA